MWVVCDHGYTMKLVLVIDSKGHRAHPPQTGNQTHETHQRSTLVVGDEVRSSRFKLRRVFGSENNVGDLRTKAPIRRWSRGMQKFRIRQQPASSGNNSSKQQQGSDHEKAVVVKARCAWHTDHNKQDHHNGKAKAPDKECFCLGRSA